MSVLIFTGTANSTGNPVEFQGDEMGDVITVTGTFGGATLTLQTSQDGTNWAPINGGVFTAPASSVCLWRYGQLIRGVLTGAGTTNVTAKYGIGI